MANRSYLYAVDEVPGGADYPLAVRAVSEWNWDIPIVHRVLMTSSPRLCRSTIWDPPMQAVLADYDGGVANLERFLAALPQTEQVQIESGAALTALHDPQRRGRYLLLEPTEVLALTLDDELEGEAFGAVMAEAYESELAEIGDIDQWLRQAGRIDSGRLAEATGGGYWSTVNYYRPGVPPISATAGAAGPTAAMSAPGPPTFAPPTEPVWSGSAPHELPLTQPPDTMPPAAAPTQPYVMPPPPPPSGSTAWAVGLLCLVPLPFLSAFVAGIVMGIVGLSQRKNGLLAAANGRHAANWGFTYALLTLLFGAAHFTLLAVLTREGPETEFFPIGIPVTIWLGISVVHIIVCLRGAVVSGRARVFAPPALPIVRAERVRS